MTPSSPTRRSSDLFTIRATLVNDDGRFTAGPLTVAVAASPPPPSLLVTQAAIDDGVLAVRFSAALGEAAPGDTLTLTGVRFGLGAAPIAYDLAGLGSGVSSPNGPPRNSIRYTLMDHTKGFSTGGR